MATRTFQVKFLTPAFLGNAEQDGQWRTPPFKALLRQKLAEFKKWTAEPVQVPQRQGCAA